MGEEAHTSHSQNLLDGTSKPQLSSTYHRRRNPTNHFPVGTLVEVQTNEEDFKAVYFSATVISPSNSPKKVTNNKNSEKLCVEYHGLLSEENNTKRLREIIDLSFARPAPTFIEVVTSESCEVNDVVDAFYLDGWWTGVVKELVKGGKKIVVTFEDPPDERVFGFEEVRVHWDWVDGSWFRPVKMSTAGTMFTKGGKVEVSPDREDNQDAWFPATIREDLGNGDFLVEYSTSDTKKKVQNVKVAIDSLHIRPCPPLLKVKVFPLLEKVDAFFDSGWWSGVVTKVLENSRYTVFFKQMKEVRELDKSELRPHMDWKDGKWFTSSQLSQDVSDDGMHGLADRNGTSDDKTPPRALSQPLKKHKKGDIPGSNQHGTHDTPIIDISLDSPLPVSEKDVTSSGTETAKQNLSSAKSSWGKRLQRKQRNVGATTNAEEKVYPTSSSRKKSIRDISHIENSGSKGKEPDAVQNNGEDIQIEHAQKFDDLPVIVGLPCAEMGTGKSGISKTKRVHASNGKESKIASDEQQQLKNPIVLEMKDSKQLQTGEPSEKRKRGRPRKTPIESIQTPLTGMIDFFTAIQSMQNPVTGNTQNAAGDSANLSENDDKKHDTPEKLAPMSNQKDMALFLKNKKKEMALNQDKPTIAQSSSPNRAVRSSTRALTELHNEKIVEDSFGMRENRSSKRASTEVREEKIVEDSTGIQENRSSKRGRHQVTDKLLTPQALDNHGAPGGITMDLNGTVEVDKVVTEASNNEFDDEPLSKWIVGLHPAPINDASRPSPVRTVEEQCTENSGKLEIEIQVPVLQDKDSILPSENQVLPFVKNAVLWETIESMEVFQRIPQRPHFKPLQELKESSREGLAIGLMVTFASMVEKTSKLQVSDPKSITDDILETLADLERHGFNVRVIRDRVTKLLAMKDKQGKLFDEVKELNERILEHNRKQSEMDEEMREMNEQIRKIDELIGEMDEKKMKLKEMLSNVETLKKNEDIEISLSRARLEEVQECINNAGREFV